MMSDNGIKWAGGLACAYQYGCRWISFYVNMFMHVNLHVCTCILVCDYIHVCKPMCIYLYVYIYIFLENVIFYT
jgi:hypothetical protein